jgi:tetratricopeptide (TPR) repeat protein
MDYKGYWDQGIAFINKKEYGQAIESFRAAQRLNPDNEDIPKFIKNLEAVVNFQADADRSVAAEAEKRAAVMGITVTDVDQAIADYEEALGRNPTDASAAYNLANAYYIRGLTFTSKREHTRAIDYYKKAIERMPDGNYPLAVNKLGQAYLDTAEFDKAIETFKELTRLSPNMAENKLAMAYQARGIAYDQKGDYARAIEDFKMVLKFEPDNSTSRELLEKAEAELAKK